MSNMEIVIRVWHRGDHSSESRFIENNMGGKDKEFLSFISKKNKKNKSRHF